MIMAICLFAAKRITAICLLFLSFIAIVATGISPLFAQQHKNKDDVVPLVASLNAYSFSDLLMARNDRDKQPVYTYFNLLDWCATKNIKALDATAYFFPTYPDVPSDEYLQSFKKRAAALGVVISGTGIRNNFASTDSNKRAEGVQLAKNWIVAASKMGAPVIRLFAGDRPAGYEDKWNEVAAWMIDCYKQLVPLAEQYHIKIGIQNHGDMLRTADECKFILAAVNSKWVGLIVDVGNFKTEDPYKDIAAVVPYAVNWQIKESVFGLESDVPTDYKRLIKIIKDGGYKGYLPIETLAVRDKPYDPFMLVPQMLNKVSAAIDSVYKY